MGAVSVAVISYNLPRSGSRGGGIERVAHDIAQGLALRGHRVTVFTHDPRPPDAKYAVRPLPWRSFVGTWAGRRLTMGYLGHVLTMLPPFGDAEVIITHGDSLLLPLRGRPVIRVMHGSALQEAASATSWGRRLLQSGVYALEALTTLTPQVCVAVSENTRSFHPLIKRVIPNGVDLTRFAPRPDIRSGRPMILFVGALAGRKRGRWLIDLFSRHIRPVVRDAELHMVCDRGDAADGVSYHPAVSDDELRALYQRAWVLASPSTYEGFGLPYVEAMACGTPVVATPNPGSHEVLAGGKYGEIVNDADFAGAVLRLLTDAGLRSHRSEKGLVRAAELSLDRTIDAYERLVLSLTTTN